MKILLAHLLLLASTASMAQSPNKPNVLIITTGGTIASRTDAPLVDGPQLVQAVPEIAEVANITVEEFVRVGSSKMTPTLWLELVKLINDRLSAQPDLQGIVITHGTDTMEETAFFLNCTHRHKTPIVLVGSMRSSNMISADGPSNLLDAVQVAASPQSAGKGVLVAMNDNISAARDLQKSHNTRVDAFVPTDKGYLGAINGSTVTFFRNPLQKHTINSDFDVYGLDALPVVDIVQDFAGLDGGILSYYLNRDNQGLVVSSFAGGRMSHGMDSLFNLPKDGKPVAIASSVRGGTILSRPEDDSALVVANDLPGNKARILLMLALTQTNEPERIQEFFDQY